ncbi:unnamed protein product, partial [Iphiclides podalirius]
MLWGDFHGHYGAKTKKQRPRHSQPLAFGPCCARAVLPLRSAGAYWTGRGEPARRSQRPFTNSPLISRRQHSTVYWTACSPHPLDRRLSTRALLYREWRRIKTNTFDVKTPRERAALPM